MCIRDSHYTTAYDMAQIARLAYTNKKFRSLLQEPAYVIEKTNKKEEPIELIQQHKMYMDCLLYTSFLFGGGLAM